MAVILLIMTCFIGRLAQASTIEITESNHVYVQGRVSAGSMVRASIKLLDLHFKLPEGEPIFVVLNSPGGSVMAGLDFIRIMEVVKLTRPVNTVALWAFSMAFSIFQHGTVRYIDNFALIGQHRAKAQFSGQFGEGELEKRLQAFTRLMKSINEYEAKRCGYTLKEWKAEIKDELWGYSSQAVNTGLADEVGQIRCSKDLVLKTLQAIDDVLAGKEINKYMQICPIIR
jgi:ATP-dependent protease ClpP protease subunit